MAARTTRPARVGFISATDASRTDDARLFGLLAVVVLAAFALRIWELAGQSFWWDEAYSALLAEKGPRAIYRELQTGDFHPPLHYLLTWAWLPLGGRSEFALRFLAVACGTLTVAIGCQLGRRLFGRIGAVAAALAFGLSPFLSYYSREARMYAPTALLAILALYLLHRALTDGRWRFWLAYALACLLGLYTFYYFVFVPVFGAVWTLAVAFRRREQLARWLASSALVTGGYLPWLPVLLGRNAVWDSGWASTSSPLKTIGWSWVSLTFGLPTLGLYEQPILAAALLGLALVLVGEVARRLIASHAAGGARGVAARLTGECGGQAAALPRRAGAPDPGLTPYLFALGAFVLPLCLIAAIAMVKPVYHPRYAIAVAPGLLLAFAGAISGSLGGGRVWSSVGVVAAALALAAAGYGQWNLATNPTYIRDDYRGAVAHIQSDPRDTDTIIYNVDPGFRYYYDGAAPAQFYPGAPYEEESIAQGLNAIAAGKTRLWYLRHFEAPTDPEGFVERQLDGHARKVEEGWYGSLRLSLYELPPTPAFATVEMAPASGDFGGKLRLTGFGLAAPEVAAGELVDVMLRWQVASTDADYGIWAGLADERGRLWGRVDHQPRDRDLRLSSRWKPGDAVTSRSPLPALIGTPPGEYGIVVGVYRLDNLRGLDLLDPGGRRRGQTLTVGRLRVLPGALGRETDPSLPIQLGAPLGTDVQLAVARIDTPRVSAGGEIRLTLLWRALAQPQAGRLFDLRAIGAGGQVLAESRTPLGDGLLASESWRDGELVRDQRALAVRADAPAGRATIQAALVTGEPARWVDVGTVDVDAVKRRFDEPEIAKRLDLDLGSQISLLGYRLEPTATKPGGTLKLTLYWRALTGGLPSYRVFTHVLDGESRILGQKDGEPRDWTHPTSAWVAGEVVDDVYEIEVQRDAPVGSYEVEIGIYDPRTGERLKVAGADGVERGDRVVLESIEVR